jgi:hypothetical protein
VPNGRAVPAETKSHVLAAFITLCLTFKLAAWLRLPAAALRLEAEAIRILGRVISIRALPAEGGSNSTQLNSTGGQAHLDDAQHDSLVTARPSRHW